MPSVAPLLFRSLVAALVLAAGLEPAAGQVSVGLQGDWGSDTRTGVGARGVVGLGAVARGLEATASFDYYFPGGDVGAEVAAWEVGLNLNYGFTAPNRRITPYVGLGLNLARYQVSTSLLGRDISGSETLGGVNLLAGAMLRAGRITPFVESRLVASDAGQFVLGLGVRIS